MPALRRGGAVKPRSPEGAPQAQGLRAPRRRKTIEDAVNREPMCVSPWPRALPSSRIHRFPIITDLAVSYSLEPLTIFIFGYALATPVVASRR